jgi:DNA polymerase III epsilon subunit-like protein
MDGAMTLIFYDFETTELSKLGQILNFSFIVTDEQFSIVDEYSDLIRIERTVLPHPGAILTNRVDVLDHQKKAKLSEKEAVYAIAEFLSRHVENSSDVRACLVGYNSAKFDLPYLNTTFIRNGVNPFGRWRNVDLFYLSQKLYHRDEKLRDLLSESQCSEKVSLSLENLCSSFGLLKGAQSHESRSDVLLTIKLAEFFASRGEHVGTQYYYEVPRKMRPGDVFWRIRPWPNYDSTATPFLLLADEKNSTLWGDLERAKEIMSSEKRDIGEACRYVSKANEMFAGLGGSLDSYSEAVERLKEEFLNIRISDFYGENTCDIEDDIFRFPLRRLGDLHRLFTREISSSSIPEGEREAKELFLRHRLREYAWGGEHDQMVWEKFETFVKEKFGGKCLLKQGGFYPSYGDLLSDTKKQKEEATRDEDRSLMANLLQFYAESDIGRVMQGKHPSGYAA